MSSNEISIEQINKLDAAAFRLLYKSYYKGLVCYAMRLIELSEPAEDIVQELFSNIWAKKMVFSHWCRLRFIYITPSGMPHLII